jgi:hypothetical protein
MTYVENVERYRRHLWKLTLSQNHEYPHRSTNAKAEFQDKLMSYARRAGFNYNSVFGQQSEELTILPGYAGKRLKARMVKEKNVLYWKRLPIIGRRVLRDNIAYLGLRDKIVFHRRVPATPIELIELAGVEEVVFVRNRNSGEIRVRDTAGNEHVYPWVTDKNMTVDQVLDAWGPLAIIGSSSTKPLFPKRSFRKSKPEQS